MGNILTSLRSNITIVIAPWRIRGTAHSVRVKRCEKIMGRIGRLLANQAAHKASLESRRAGQMCRVTTVLWLYSALAITWGLAILRQLARLQTSRTLKSWLR